VPNVSFFADTKLIVSHHCPAGGKTHGVGMMIPIDQKIDSWFFHTLYL
jgi:hypothetical protein